MILQTTDFFIVFCKKYSLNNLVQIQCTCRSNINNPQECNVFVFIELTTADIEIFDRFGLKARYVHCLRIEINVFNVGVAV